MGPLNIANFAGGWEWGGCGGWYHIFNSFLSKYSGLQWFKCHPLICMTHRRLHFYFDPEKLWHPILQTPYISPNLLAKHSSLTFPLCFYYIVGKCGTFLAWSCEYQANVCYFLMYGVLPGGVFVGAPLTPPRGVVKSTWGNHQLHLIGNQFTNTYPCSNIWSTMLFNFLRAKFFRGNIKYIFTFHVIPPRWYDTSGLNPSSNTTRTYPFCIVNVMAADVLTTQEARTSTAMLLTQLNRDNSVPRVKG